MFCGIKRRALYSTKVWIMAICLACLVFFNLTQDRKEKLKRLQFLNNRLLTTPVKEEERLRQEHLQLQRKPVKISNTCNYMNYLLIANNSDNGYNDNLQNHLTQSENGHLCLQLFIILCTKLIYFHQRYQLIKVSVFP